MQIFLNDFVRSLTFRGQARAHSVLEAAKIEKTQLDIIAEKLASQSFFANLEISEEKEGSLIRASSIETSIDDAHRRIIELYSLSNDVSLLLNSNSSILTSEIQSLHDELSALEKSIANYSFMLADGGTYDYAFLESFNDTRNSEEFDFFLTDRHGLLFSSDEKALVAPDEGALALPQDISRTYSLTGKMIECNCTSQITSANSLVNAFNNNNNAGWRMSASTATPINATLPSFRTLYSETTEYPGANATLELVLPAPSPCDNIRINPYADAPFNVVQVELYPSLDESVKINLLEAPAQIDSSKSFYFKLQPVAKIKVYLQQPLYRRNGLEPDKGEVTYKKITDPPIPPIEVINTKPPTYNKPKRISFLSRLVQLLFTAGKKIIQAGVKVIGKVLDGNQFRTTAPQTMFAPSWGTFRDDLSSITSSHRKASSKWVNQTVKSSAIEVAAVAKLSLDFIASFLPRLFIQRRTTSSTNPNNNPTPQTPAPTPVQPLPTVEREITYMTPEQFKYEYNFGIKSVQVGNALTGFKGVFISKILPSPSDVGEVKMKVSETQYLDTSEGRDQPIITSVEYSVSNQAKPDQENDWVPIMPTGQSQVFGERFFTDDTGKGYFRFGASLEEDITLYKNGYQVSDFDPNAFLIRSGSLQFAIGLKLPSGYATSQDIFTVDYTPIIDSSIINFQKAGYEVAPLVSSFDENGAGEGFTGTAGQLIVDLLYEPYVDYTRVDSSTYSTTLGLNPYNPVIVVLDDGTIAYNLTNYKGEEQAPLNASAALSFLHNGTALMFNKPVDQAFRIYYQYLPNNLRFRVVLRSNVNEYVSPKVDFVQIKAKTRKADARRA